MDFLVVSLLGAGLIGCACIAVGSYLLGRHIGKLEAWTGMLRGTVEELRGMLSESDFAALWALRQYQQDHARVKRAKAIRDLFDE